MTKAEIETAIAETEIQLAEFIEVRALAGARIISRRLSKLRWQLKQIST